MTAHGTDLDACRAGSGAEGGVSEDSTAASQHKRVLQQAYMQRAVLHKDDAAKSEADAAAAAAYGNRLARIMTSEVRGVLLGVCVCVRARGRSCVDSSVHLPCVELNGSVVFASVVIALRSTRMPPCAMTPYRGCLEKQAVLLLHHRRSDRSVVTSAGLL